MTQYKLVCSDIDGTLLDSTRDLSEGTVQAVQALDQIGIPFVMISARMPRAMRPFQQKIGINQPVVCFNGAYIESPVAPDGSITVLRNRTIDYEVFIQMLEALQSYPIHLSAFHKDTWYANQHDTWTEREINNTRNTPTDILPIEDMIRRFGSRGFSAHKLLLMGDVAVIEEIYHKLCGVFGQWVDVYRSKDTYLEINAKAVSKDKSLPLLCKYFGISPDQIVAYGDNYNDIGMLSAVGLGVAVENANDSVKKAAKQLTDKNIYDGVAKSLRNIFDI